MSFIFQELIDKILAKVTYKPTKDSYWKKQLNKGDFQNK